MKNIFNWAFMDPDEKSTTREFVEILVLYVLFIGVLLIHEQVPARWLGLSLALLLGIIWEQTRELLRVLLVAGIIVFGLIRPYVVQAFYIPSRSMENTLLVNDHIFVNNFSYRVYNPERWDIIVFEYPNQPSRDYIKRLIGLPGDKVSIRDEKLHVNGKQVPRRYLESEVELQFQGPVLSSSMDGDLKTIRFPGDGLRLNTRTLGHDSQDPVQVGMNVTRIYRESGNHRIKRITYNGSVVGEQYTRDFGPIEIPEPGETVQLDQVSSMEKRYYFNLMQQWFGDEIRIENGVFYVDGVPKRELKIREKLYFAMGDNRDQSEDSRVWGFVPEHRLLGEAVFIYWPLDRVGIIGN